MMVVWWGDDSRSDSRGDSRDTSRDASRDASRDTSGTNTYRISIIVYVYICIIGGLTNYYNRLI